MALPADLSVFVGRYNYAPTNWAVVTVSGDKLVWSQFYSGGAAADAVFDMTPMGGNAFRCTGAGAGAIVTIGSEHLTHSATGDHPWPKQGQHPPQRKQEQQPQRRVPEHAVAEGQEDLSGDFACASLSAKGSLSFLGDGAWRWSDNYGNDWHPLRSSASLIAPDDGSTITNPSVPEHTITLNRNPRDGRLVGLKTGPWEWTREGGPGPVPPAWPVPKLWAAKQGEVRLLRRAKLRVKTVQRVAPQATSPETHLHSHPRPARRWTKHPHTALVLQQRLHGEFDGSPHQGDFALSLWGEQHRKLPLVPGLTTMVGSFVPWEEVGQVRFQQEHTQYETQLVPSAEAEAALARLGEGWELFECPTLTDVERKELLDTHVIGDPTGSHEVFDDKESMCRELARVGLSRLDGEPDYAYAHRFWSELGKHIEHNFEKVGENHGYPPSHCFVTRAAICDWFGRIGQGALRSQGIPCRSLTVLQGQFDKSNNNINGAPCRWAEWAGHIEFEIYLEGCGWVMSVAPYSPGVNLAIQPAVAGAHSPSGCAGSTAAQLRDVHRLVGADASYALQDAGIAHRAPRGRKPFPDTMFMLGAAMLAVPGTGPPECLPCPAMERVDVQPFPFEVEARYLRADLYPKLEGVYYNEEAMASNPDLLAGLHTESQEIHEVNPNGSLGKCIQQFGPEIIPVSAAEVRAQREAAVAASRDKVVPEAGDGSDGNPVMARALGVQARCLHMPHVDGGDLSVFAGRYNYAPTNWAVVTVSGDKLVWSQFYSGGAAADAVFDMTPMGGNGFRCTGAGAGAIVTIGSEHLTHSATGDHPWRKQAGSVLRPELKEDLATVKQRYYA